MEFLGAVAALVTIIAGLSAALTWWNRRRQPQTPAPTHVIDAPVEDMWVDLKYVDDAGVAQRLKEEGFQLRWSAANDEARRINLEGWEPVVDTLDDGRSVKYKIHDHPVIGGYLILLKRREGFPPKQ